jgi:two-component system cell cycle response regulator
MSDFSEVDVSDGRLSGSDLSQYDLIMVSLCLSNADGLRLCSQIKTMDSSRHTPIIILVDEEDNDKMITAMEMGVADYLIRPVDRHELTVRVKSQIRQKLYADSLRDNMKKNMEMAVTDSVTGLYNRHFLDNHLGNLLSPNNEDRDAVGIIMMDLDFFKKVNDTYGHAAGDEVLAEFARRVTRNIRSIDLAVRYGGEEFIVVVPESDAEFTITVAERIRKAIEAKPFEVSTHTETIPVTVSIGVSLSEDKYMDGGALMIAADKALYEAKETGRNKVCGLAS